MSTILSALKSTASAKTQAQAPSRGRTPLEEKLLAAGVSAQLLDEAREARAKSGGGFFETLLRKKALDEKRLLQILSDHYGLPVWRELPMESIDVDFTRLATIAYLKKYKMVPIITAQAAAIAISDPTHFQPADDLRHLLRRDDL